MAPAVGKLEAARYLTDGTGLYWIVRVDSEKCTVLLEDCGSPDMPLVEHRVRDLATEGFAVVRREYS